MKKFKKITSFILIMSAVAVLAGCGEKADDLPDKTSPDVQKEDQDWVQIRKWQLMHGLRDLPM